MKICQVIYDAFVCILLARAATFRELAHFPRVLQVSAEVWWMWWIHIRCSNY